MSLDLWIAFVVATTALLIVPGPTVTVVVSYALGRGRDTAWATVPGVMLGDFTAMTVSLLGAGAVLAASSALFTTLKLVGAAYLIFIGIRLWRSKPHFDDATRAAAGIRSKAQMFWNAYIVTTLNPRVLFFSLPSFRNLSIRHRRLSSSSPSLKPLLCCWPGLTSLSGRSWRAGCRRAFSVPKRCGLPTGLVPVF